MSETVAEPVDVGVVEPEPVVSVDPLAAVLARLAAVEHACGIPSSPAAA